MELMCATHIRRSCVQAFARRSCSTAIFLALCKAIIHSSLAPPSNGNINSIQMPSNLASLVQLHVFSQMVVSAHDVHESVCEALI
ncbi:hypothetical protein TNCV_1834221 [Trichonephila clavipes]|nr:hypothetical protein TNCV_1834221 [Trichonephila clavipes]